MKSSLLKTLSCLLFISALVYTGCKFGGFETDGETVSVSMNVNRAASNLVLTLTATNTADSEDVHKGDFTVKNNTATGTLTGLKAGATYKLYLSLASNGFIHGTASKDVTIKVGNNPVEMVLEYTSMKDILSAFESASKGNKAQFVLKSDVDWTQCASLGSMFGNPPQKPADFTLDLNGFTIYYNVPKEYDFRNPMIFFGNVGEGARFTVKNGKVNGKKVSESSFISARTDDEIGQVYNQYIVAEDLEIQGFEGSVFYMLGGKNQTATYNNKLTLKNIKISDCGSSRPVIYMVEHGTVNATNVEITDCKRAVEIWDHDTVFNNVKIYNCGINSDENPFPAVLFGNGTAVLTGDTVIEVKGGCRALWMRPLAEGNNYEASNVIMAGASIIDNSDTSNVSTVLVDGGNSAFVMTDFYRPSVSGSDYVEYRCEKNVIRRKVEGMAIEAAVAFAGEVSPYDHGAKVPGASQIGIGGNCSITGLVFLESRNGGNDSFKSLINKIGAWNEKIATIAPGSISHQLFQFAEDCPEGLIGGAFTVKYVSYDQAVTSFDLIDSPLNEFVNWEKSEDKYIQYKVNKELYP